MKINRNTHLGLLALFAAVMVAAAPAAAQQPQRPNIVANPNDGPQNPQQWFKTSVFSLPALYTFGNAPRNAVIGPGLQEFDLSLQKDIRLKEATKLQFRAEAFNLANHSQFGLPNANVSALGSFGKITQPLNPGATGTGTPRQFQLMLRLSF